MEDIGKKFSTSQKAAVGVSQVLQHRLNGAQTRLTEKVKKAYEEHVKEAAQQARASTPWAEWQGVLSYAVDAAQRSILFLDTLRQRGDDFVENTQKGMPPLLHFGYEMVMDGREFEQPVNYALVRIIPPAGVEINNKQRPYIIIDPRAGHGPGIGGFKDDSQVGVGLRAGHPVYFVIFFPRPEPGQTMLDVTEAELSFIRKVRALHPESNKPVIVGNCQAGWAAMMLAVADPEDTGPVIINGAPMAYLSGAWTEGSGNNVMRYSGGFLGGTWLSSLTADMGNGLFDGANLVQNFENLDPANTFWSKYRNLYAKIDTEPQRFLDFERWWGANPLLAREEIEWITQNLFVGNDLWSGGMKTKGGKTLSLRDIRTPIIMFASLGDNITPPQQAFNWVADTYKSTDEIKANGQVIIGLLHRSIGHLGIFVSGKVMNKEYTEMVSVMQCIEALPPGMYGMEIHETGDATAPYTVNFVEYRLEDVVKRLNRLERVDEQPFKAVEALSEFNQRAYELFAQPWVQAMSNEYMAQTARIFHPLRAQHWIMSRAFNPLMNWLPAAAEKVREARRPVGDDKPLKQLEAAGSDVIESMLDYYRDVRDALGEAVFFTAYTTPYALNLAEKQGGLVTDKQFKPVTDPRELPFVKDALAHMESGGYATAVTRTVSMLEHEGDQLTLNYLEFKHDMIAKYRDLLPNLQDDEQRRLRGEQDIICRYEPVKALLSLPKLLQTAEERERFVTLFDRLEMDPAVTVSGRFSDEQRKMLARIRQAIVSVPEKVPAKKGTSKKAATSS